MFCFLEKICYGKFIIRFKSLKYIFNTISAKINSKTFGKNKKSLKIFFIQNNNNKLKLVCKKYFTNSNGKKFENKKL